MLNVEIFTAFPQLCFSNLFPYLYVFLQQQMLTDPMMMAQQQSFGQVSIPTPTAMIIKQASMSPPVARRMQPSPNPSRRSVVIPSPQIQHHPSAMASPVPSPMLSQRRSPSPQPSMRSGFVNVQRPPSVISRQISPLSSPSLIGHQKTHRLPSPLTRRPSPPQSPRGSIIRRSPPTSPRASMRLHSPPSSPRASMRRRSPPPSASPARSPFGGRKIYASPSPPLSPGHRSPPLSPQLSRPSPSPSPSHRSLSPTGPRPAPSSPTLSRRSTRLLRDPTPLVRPRMGGNIPLGTVRPSPMGLRGRPVPPPTQNVRPFRPSSIRSNRSSVLTVDSLHSSPFNSPHMVHRAPLRRRESGRFPSRPVARGRPLMAQQSMRRMPPSSPQPPLKHMSRPASPHFSPRLSYQSSPHLPPRTASPPSYVPETHLSGPYTDPHTEQFDQLVAPSSSILSGALQNEAIRQASFMSPLAPETAQGIGMGEMATEYLEPYVPPSPSLSSAMQNQAIRDASYVTQLQKPMSPYEQPVPPSYPILSGALQNQAVREASYTSPLPRPQSPYTPSVPSSPLLSGALRHGQALRGVASYQTPTLHSPYGPTVVTAYDYISEPGPAPLLHDALQNRSNLQNVSSLKSPVMQRRNPYAPVGPHVHSALQQNPNLRHASYQTPVQLRRSPYGPPPPSSPILGSALQNPQLMQASYRLPDGTLVSPYADSRSSPLIGHALQNQQVRGASYILPDGSVMRVGIKGTSHVYTWFKHSCRYIG